MRPCIALVLLTPLCAAVTALAQPQAGERAYLPVPPPRLEVAGFTWQPPPEQGWLLEDRTADAVLLMKFQTGDHFHLIVGQRIATGEVRDQRHLVELLSRSTDINGMEPVTESIEPVERADALCVRRVQKFQDVPELRPAWMTGPVDRDDAEFWCRHPGRASVVVTLYYSHVHPPGEESPEFVQFADRLMEGVRFTPLD
jgi:hypothetical protein